MTVWSYRAKDGSDQSSARLSIRRATLGDNEMLKKIVTMAMAVSVVVALSAPSAMGAWKHHNTAIQTNQQIQLTGNTKFQAVGVGSIQCSITVQATLSAGQTTGTITQFAVDLDPLGSTVTQVCLTGGFLGECQVHAMQPTNLPWVIHTGTTKSANNIDVTHGEVHTAVTGAFCPVTSITKTAGTFELEPNQPNTVTSFKLLGNAEVHDVLIDGQQITANTVVSGTLTILGTGAHTYSV